MWVTHRIFKQTHVFMYVTEHWYNVHVLFFLIKQPLDLLEAKRFTLEKSFYNVEQFSWFFWNYFSDNIPINLYCFLISGQNGQKEKKDGCSEAGYQSGSPAVSPRTQTIVETYHRSSKYSLIVHKTKDFSSNCFFEIMKFDSVIFRPTRNRIC